MAELHPEPPPLDPTLLRGELQRLRGEYDSLKAAAEEAAACPGLEVAGVDVGIWRCPGRNPQLLGFGILKRVP